MITLMAKGVSKRFERKNLQLFRGLPLFVHAILYAQQEGYNPTVFTDEVDGEIGEIARMYGAEVLPQFPGETEDYSSVLRVITSRREEKFIAHLQATNPFRVRGRMKELISRVLSGEGESFYTAEEVKVNGVLGTSSFRRAITSSPDSTLMRYDGGMVVCTPEFFIRQGGYFLGDGSIPIPEVYPLTWDIDFPYQLKEAEEISRRYPEYLPDLREGKVKWEDRQEGWEEGVFTSTLIDGEGYRIYPEEGLIIPEEGTSPFLPSYVILREEKESLTVKGSDGNPLVFSSTPGGWRNTSGEVGDEERVDIFLSHPRWDDKVYFNLSTMRGSRSTCLDRFTVMEYRPGEVISLRWDNWGEETFRYLKEKKEYRKL